MNSIEFIQKDAIVFVNSFSPWLKNVAKKLGLQTICLSTLNNEPHSDCDFFHYVSDAQKTLSLLKEKENKICGIIAECESGVELADWLRDQLQLANNKISLSQARRNKAAMRRTLKNAGIETPDFSTCRTKDEVCAFVKKHPFPLVIKTPQGAGSHLVSICNTLHEIIDAFDIILTSHDFLGHIPSYALLEEYIGGDEYVVDVFADGESIYVTDIWKYEKINSIVYQNTILMSLEETPFLKKLTNYAFEVCHAVGLSRGPAHLELKVDPERGPILIEIGCRFAGGEITRLVKDAASIDLYDKAIESFTSKRATFPSKINYSKHCAVLDYPFFQEEQEGIVCKIEGIEKIRGLKSYYDHQLSLEIDQKIVPNQHMLNLPLVVQLSHADKEQLERDMRIARELFKVELKR